MKSSAALLIILPLLLAQSCVTSPECTAIGCGEATYLMLSPTISEPGAYSLVVTPGSSEPVTCALEITDTGFSGDCDDPAVGVGWAQTSGQDASIMRPSNLPIAESIYLLDRLHEEVSVELTAPTQNASEVVRTELAEEEVNGPDCGVCVSRKGTFNW